MLGKIFKRCSMIETIRLSDDWIRKTEEHGTLREALNGIFVEKLEITGFSNQE